LRSQPGDDSANELSGADYPTDEKASAVLRAGIRAALDRLISE
jgi:hypothetical protein